MPIIEVCDDRSRWVDSCPFVTPPKLFWSSNQKAIDIWGSGFTFDRAADCINVQPADSQHRLSFNSRWGDPFAAGVDMFNQAWGGHISWVNAPFSIVPRVLSLIRVQQVRAAVVVPLGGKAVWLQHAVVTHLYLSN